MTSHTEPWQFQAPDGSHVEVKPEEFYALRNAINAAHAIVTENGKPGMLDRVEVLRARLETATDDNPILAILIAAAVWADRYGSSGAPQRLTALRHAVGRLEKGAPS
jgi:hypothetical protein